MTGFIHQGIHYDRPGEYRVEVTVENACGIRTVTDTFLVQQSTDLSLPGDTSICINAGAWRLKAEPAGGTWSGPGMENGRFSPAAAGAGTHRLIYQFGVGACFMESDLSIEVLEAPAVDVGPDLSLCTNDAPVDLNGLPAGGRVDNRRQPGPL